MNRAERRKKEREMRKQRKILDSLSDEQIEKIKERKRKEIIEEVTTTRRCDLCVILEKDNYCECVGEYIDVFETHETYCEGFCHHKQKVLDELNRQFKKYKLGEVGGLELEIID